MSDLKAMGNEPCYLCGKLLIGGSACGCEPSPAPAQTLEERLLEPIIADAFERRTIIDVVLAERLIRERSEAADEIARLKVALSEAREEAIEEGAKIAENPYSDAVDGRGGDEPFAIGRKIAAAIRSLSRMKAGE